MQYLHQDKHDSLRKEVYKLEAKRRVKRQRPRQASGSMLHNLASRPHLVKRLSQRY